MTFTTETGIAEMRVDYEPEPDPDVVIAARALLAALNLEPVARTTRCIVSSSRFASELVTGIMTYVDASTWLHRLTCDL